MFQLPPIKRERGNNLELDRKVSRGKECSDNRPAHLEPQRRQSEPVMGRTKHTPHTDIQVTNETDDEIFDLGYLSVREAMGSPVPRCLRGDALNLDKRTLESDNGSHPKITIDMCGDVQNGRHERQRHAGNGMTSLGFGQPITRSLSANNLLSAPYPVDTQNKTLQKTESDGYSRRVVTYGSKQLLPYGMCRSEGNIPMSLDQTQVTKCMTSLPGQSFDPRETFGPRRVLRRGPHTRGGSVESKSVISSEVTLADLDHRPSSPVPRRGNCSPDYLDYISPTVPVKVSVTPPLSPQLSPMLSPKDSPYSHVKVLVSPSWSSDGTLSASQKIPQLASLTPPLSPEWSPRSSSRVPIRASLTPPMSPNSRRRATPTSPQTTLVKCPISPINSDSPRAVPKSPTLSPGSSPRRRLLPLRCDRSEA